MQNMTSAAFGSTARAVSERAEFIRKTYFNLAVALLVFAGCEWLLMSWQPAVELAARMVSGGNWLFVLLVFMGISWVANAWAANPSSIGTQYAGLYLYVIAESIVFLPLLIFAYSVDPSSIAQAAILTGALSAGLMFYVFISGKDFSFLGSILTVGFFISLALIVCAILFGFNLGFWFSGGMIVFAAIAIIYQTSAVVRVYENSQYVSAALGLFAAIALLFWYILQFIQISRK